MELFRFHNWFIFNSNRFQLAVNLFQIINNEVWNLPNLYHVKQIQQSDPPKICITPCPVTTFVKDRCPTHRISKHKN